jgi:alkylation response protein AidB-like acyl-CoA dehydrogenase
MAHGDNPGPELSQLKIVAAAAVQHASELLIEVAGGSGANVGRETIHERSVDLTGAFFGHFSQMIASGTNDIQRNIIARRVLKLS